MISNVAYDTQAHELALLLEIFHDEAARLTQEQWQMDFFSEEDAFAAFIKDDPLGIWPVWKLPEMKGWRL